MAQPSNHESAHWRHMAGLAPLHAMSTFLAWTVPYPNDHAGTRRIAAMQGTYSPPRRSRSPLGLQQAPQLAVSWSALQSPLRKLPLPMVHQAIECQPKVHPMCLSGPLSDCMAALARVWSLGAQTRAGVLQTTVAGLRDGAGPAAGAHRQLSCILKPAGSQLTLSGERLRAWICWYAVMQHQAW